jgi:hypothetical protein
MTHSLVCCAHFHRCGAGAEPTIAPSAEPTEDPTLAPTSSSFRFVHTGAPRHRVTSELSIPATERNELKGSDESTGGPGNRCCIDRLGHITRVAVLHASVLWRGGLSGALQTDVVGLPGLPSVMPTLTPTFTPTKGPSAAPTLLPSVADDYNSLMVMRHVLGSV